MAKLYTNITKRQRREMVEKIRENWSDETPPVVVADTWIEGLAQSLLADMTPSELRLWKAVKPLGFRPQVVLCSYIVDFLHEDKKLVVEVDGSVHDKQGKRDRYRTLMLNKSGYNVLRFSNNLVSSDLQFVLESIKNNL